MISVIEPYTELYTMVCGPPFSRRIKSTARVRRAGPSGRRGSGLKGWQHGADRRSDPNGDIGAFDYLRPELTQSGKRELNPHGQND